MIIKNSAGMEFVLVPRVATEAMIDAGDDKDDFTPSGNNASAEVHYDAMIAAAPAFGEPHPDVVEECMKSAMRAYDPLMPHSREVAATTRAVLRKLLGR